MNRSFSGLPIEAYIDNTIVDKWFQSTNGKKLVVKTLPRTKWNESYRQTFGGEAYLSLFEMPYGNHLSLQNLKAEIRRMEGKDAIMSSLPHLKTYNKTSLEIDLKSGKTYDILTMAKRKEDAGRRIVFRGRFVTKKLNEVPSPVTFEEMKFLLIESLVKSPKEVRGWRTLVGKKSGLSIRTTSYGAHITDGSQEEKYNTVVAGFNFVYATEPPITVYSEIRHDGVVNLYNFIEQQED